MADRLEVPKITHHILMGPGADSLTASKVVMYLVLTPGDDSSVETPVRVSHVYAQKITRA